MHRPQPWLAIGNQRSVPVRLGATKPGLSVGLSSLLNPGQTFVGVADPKGGSTPSPPIITLMDPPVPPPAPGSFGGNLQGAVRCVTMSPCCSSMGNDLYARLMFFSNRPGSRPTVAPGLRPPHQRRPIRPSASDNGSGNRR